MKKILGLSGVFGLVALVAMVLMAMVTGVISYAPRVEAAASVRHVPGDYPTIQEGINAASDGDTVLIADGIYTGTGNRNLDFGGRAITVESEDGPAHCIIDCEGAGRGFYFHTGEGAGSVLRGITVQHGSADNGGGIYCASSSPSITNCTISGNSANSSNYSSGGGIYCYQSSSPGIADCTISGNTAVGIAGSQGGGLYCELSSPSVTNCTISQNSAAGSAIKSLGGGIFITSSSASITNCIICQNSASSNYKSMGGGIFCRASSLASIVNCTISQNSSQNLGGGIYGFDSASSPGIINCILWEDSPQEVSIGNGTIGSGTLTITCSDVQGGYAGEGNIDAEPQFKEPSKGNFHLLSISACIDAGTSFGAPLTDKDGKPRPSGRGYDMGAYEFESANLIKLEQFNALSKGGYIVATWSTASEIDNAGFNLLRSKSESSESENGTYIKISPRIIEAEGNAASGAEYSFIDITAVPGITYYYKLEDIDTRGVSTFYGPVSAIIPAPDQNGESSLVNRYSQPLWLYNNYLSYPLLWGLY
jgi:hypothetical protein